MRNQRTIEQRIAKLHLTLEAHRRQISRLGLQDSELLSILQAERQMIFTEIHTLKWVLEDSPEDTLLADRTCPHPHTIIAGRWSPAGSSMSQAAINCADAPGIGRPRLAF